MLLETLVLVSTFALAYWYLQALLLLEDTHSFFFFQAEQVIYIEGKANRRV